MALPINGFAGYFVNKRGSVYSDWIYKSNGRRGSKKRLLKKWIRNGYWCVNLVSNGCNNFKSIHRLVLETYLPVIGMDKLHCAHDDGNRKNNRLENLKWATPKENNADKKKHGTWQGGVKNPAHKLKEDDIREIRVLLGRGMFQREIGEIFGVSQTTIYLISKGRTWSHII